MIEIAASAVRTSRVLITENGTVGHVPIACGAEPRRQYLTEREVDQLIKSAEKRGRYGKRDGLMILIAYRHGLRRSELVGLRWRQVDLAGARLHVIRRKGGDDSVHELNERELRGLGRLRKQQEPGQAHVFVSERGSPFTGDGFDKILRRAAAAIGMDDVHSHLLRHGTGYRLANEGRDTRGIQGFLGHRQIGNTVRYTKLNADRFRGW
jgi:integrase